MKTAQGSPEEPVRLSPWDFPRVPRRVKDACGAAWFRRVFRLLEVRKGTTPPPQNPPLKAFFAFLPGLPRLAISKAEAPSTLGVR